MTTTHDTGISWTECPVCAELHREVERADAEADKAWETYSSVDFQYREARDDGRVGFGTKAWTQWHDLLDQLLHAYYDAADAHRARLEAWGESIREHDEPQTTEAETPAAETPERKITISKANAADELVNVYEGHIDKWLEALRERSFEQTEEMPVADREKEDAINGKGHGDLRAVADPDEDGQAARGCDDGIDDADAAACGFPETTVWAYDAKQGRCHAFQVGGMIATAAACAKAHRDGYLNGLKEARDLLDGIIADHDKDTDADEACTHEGGA